MNIFIAGVGGQGTLFASRVLGNYASLIGKDCKLSEVHGMAQRGGSVVTHVKIADKVYSPIISEGDADVLLAFELLEALRYAHMIKKGGLIIVNSQQWNPLPVITGAAEYPADIPERLTAFTDKVFITDALHAAAEAGNIKAANTVMVGALTGKLGLDYEIMRKALEMTVPEKVKEVNLSALEKGYGM